MIQIENTFSVETHPGVTISNPDIELIQTIDTPNAETFTPCVVIHSGANVAIYHELTPQPYVNGTWEDSDVTTAITQYFLSL